MAKYVSILQLYPCDLKHTFSKKETSNKDIDKFIKEANDYYDKYNIIKE